MMTIKAVVNAVKHEKWCQILTVLMRITVGGVFIFSGFTKGVDPWGTYYKITDYLNAMGLEQWAGTALFAAFALAALEFMLGVALAVGAYRRSAPWLALLAMLVMTPLTLWLAVTGAVPDCGCFGDALHLSNWATFGKNVLLLLGTIYLLLFNTSVRGIYGPAVQWMVMALSFAFVMAVAYFGYFTQPLIDYRPYPIGTRLVNATTMSDSDEGEDDFIFIYSRDGKEQEFTIDSLPDEEDGWEYVTLPCPPPARESDCADQQCRGWNRHSGQWRQRCHRRCARRQPQHPVAAVPRPAHGGGRQLICPE